MHVGTTALFSAFPRCASSTAQNNCRGDDGLTLVQLLHYIYPKLSTTVCEGIVAQLEDKIKRTKKLSVEGITRLFKLVLLPVHPPVSRSGLALWMFEIPEGAESSSPTALAVRPKAIHCHCIDYFLHTPPVYTVP